MSNTRKAGFTLIELLVVIAIIGILSSIVIASLGAARQKGRASAVKGAMQQLLTQGQIYISDHSAYAVATTSPRIGCYNVDTFLTDEVFFFDNIPSQMVTNIDANGAPIACAISANGKSFSLVANIGPQLNLCIDSEGNRIEALLIETDTGICTPSVIETPVYMNNGGNMSPGAVTINAGTQVNFYFTGNSQTRTMNCTNGGPSYTFTPTNNFYTYQFNSPGSYFCKRDTNGGQGVTITVN
jgi:prepilin-type N-terminal cleavage/methylation domain-containing protein